MWDKAIIGDLVSSVGKRIGNMRGHASSLTPSSCETLGEVLQEEAASLAGIASAWRKRSGGLPGDCRGIAGLRIAWTAKFRLRLLMDAKSRLM